MVEEDIQINNTAPNKQRKHDFHSNTRKRKELEDTGEYKH